MDRSLRPVYKGLVANDGLTLDVSVDRRFDLDGQPCLAMLAFQILAGCVLPDDDFKFLVAAVGHARDVAWLDIEGLRDAKTVVSHRPNCNFVLESSAARGIAWYSSERSTRFEIPWFLNLRKYLREKMSNSEQQSVYMSFGDFLDQYYRQFAIMGIFGTVSVFLSGNFPGDEGSLIARAGTFASLLIFAITAVWIANQSFGHLLQGFNEGDRPISTDIGFAIIAICSGTLGLSIVVSITTYAEVLEFAKSIGAAVFILIGYAKLYPNQRFEKENKDIHFLTIALSLFILHIADSGVLRLVRNFTETSWISDGLIMLFIVSTHFTLSESIVGVEKCKKEYNINRESIFSKITELDRERTFDNISIDYSISIYISSLVFVTFWLGMSFITGSNSLASHRSYYSVFGIHWEEFIVRIFSAFNILVICGVWLSVVQNTDEYIIDRYGQIVLIIVLILAISILLLSFVGRLPVRVIPI